MVSKSYVGIDIGASQIKFVISNDGAIKKVATFDVPDNMVKNGKIVSYEAMAETLKTAAKDAGINERSAAISLSPQEAFLRRIQVPKMTVEQLELNLPYEFRDYISDGKDQYFYDYAVVEELEEGFDILAAATAKQLVSDFREMLKRAGFKLAVAIPGEMGLGNLIKAFEVNHPNDGRKDYCIVDLGHEGTRVHLYRDGSFEVTRMIDLGGRHLDMAIADNLGVDEYVAKSYKHTNYKDCLSLPECTSIYGQIGVEIMGVINFYGFNYPDTQIDKAYICGGGVKIEGLTAQIRNSISLELGDVAELMPPMDEAVEDSFLYPVALGIAMQ